VHAHCLHSTRRAAQPLPPPPRSHRQALAELNITLSAFQHMYSDLRLLEHHTFTRCPKALAFEKVGRRRGQWSEG
jgi:hypothetical protein